MNPIDLLPITRPLESTSESIDETYFYENVVKHLIPDIIRMEMAGIPISIPKVVEVEKVVNDVLESVKTKLATNPIMLRFLEHQEEEAKKNKASAIASKTKDASDFTVVFSPKNKIHRSKVVNYHLTQLHKEKFIQNEWSIKDLKLLLSMVSTPLLEALAKNEIPQDTKTVEAAMQELCEEKARIYNESVLKKKIDELQNKKLIDAFNPGSSKQKAEFFQFYNIESENTTATGNQQWDRKSLQSLQTLLGSMLDASNGVRQDSDS